MKIKDLPPGTKFLFYWLETNAEDHIGTVINAGVAECSCGSPYTEGNYEEEVYPILEWEDEL
jgi:hypothetical protein